MSSQICGYFSTVRICSKLNDLQQADTYIKRKLSDRMISLSDGTVVQRDCYSSFLLYCYSFDSKAIDKDKCKAEFARFLKNEQDLIAYIKTHNINVFNSGI